MSALKDRPKYKVRVFEGEQFISLKDHLAEIERYKNALKATAPNDLAKLMDVFFNGRKA